jgi:hypothetical protein
MFRCTVNKSVIWTCALAAPFQNVLTGCICVPRVAVWRNGVHPLLHIISRITGPAPRSLSIIRPFRSPISAQVFLSFPNHRTICLVNWLFTYSLGLSDIPLGCRYLVSSCVYSELVASDVWAPSRRNVPIGPECGDDSAHGLYGHAAHHSKTRWIFPPVLNVFAPFAADNEYHTFNAALWQDA